MQKHAKMVYRATAHDITLTLEKVTSIMTLSKLAKKKSFHYVQIDNS